jgi:uncharacterized protein YjiS (DUF1127 family)
MARRPAGLAALRSLRGLPGLVAAWRERIRLRRALARMAKANPYLIDDIGLTRREAEAEIAKPFWEE